MQGTSCKMSGVQINFTERDADHDRSAIATELEGIELDSVDNGTVTGAIPNYESKDAHVEQPTKSLSADRGAPRSKPCLSATSLRRVQVAALVAVVIVVWGLLALPIVFYHLPAVSFLDTYICL